MLFLVTPLHSQEKLEDNLSLFYSRATGPASLLLPGSSISMFLAFYVRIELLCFLDCQWSWDPSNPMRKGQDIEVQLQEDPSGLPAQIVRAFIYGDPFASEPLETVLFQEANGVWRATRPSSWSSLKPEDWDSLADKKRRLLCFSDVSLYELHIRGFSGERISHLLHPHRAYLS
ncbi:hypothetical protein Droror1_Dr00002756 [Drosera rotundifolia]